MSAEIDIAFQTNILALNVAVEVRTLAMKNQKSAKETASLIKMAIEKTNHGNNIAHNTAESFD